MPTASEFKALSKEMACARAELQKTQEELDTERMASAIRQADDAALVEMQVSQIKQLKHRIEFYEPAQPVITELDTDQAEKGDCGKGIRQGTGKAGPKTRTQGRITQEVPYPVQDARA